MLRALDGRQKRSLTEFPRMKARLIRVLDGEVGGVIDYSSSTVHLACDFVWMKSDGTFEVVPPRSDSLLTHQYLGIADLSL
jgi:hypothetical protein